MGNTDSIPVISQIKSAVQAIAGDKEGALQTQLNFAMGCPIVSQIGAAGAAIFGNTEYPRKSQYYFCENMSTLIDTIPIAGHGKALIHYYEGEGKKGDDAMKAASRTAGVLLAGIGGFAVGGPVGSVAAGVAAGAAMDGVITVAESAVKDEYVPSGHFEYATRAINGELDAGGYFDWVLTPLNDGLTGRNGAKSFRKPGVTIHVDRSTYASDAKLRETLEEDKREGFYVPPPPRKKKTLNLDTKVVYSGHAKDMAVVKVSCRDCGEVQRLVRLRNVQVDANGCVSAAEVAKAVQESFERDEPKLCPCQEE